MKEYIKTFNLDEKSKKGLLKIRRTLQARDLEKGVTASEAVRYALTKVAEEIKEETVE